MKEYTKRWKIIGAVVRTLTLVFIALRACDVIDWPWWCVLAPIIAAYVFAMLLLIVVGAVYADEI